MTEKESVWIKLKLDWQFFPSSANAAGPNWTNLSDRIWGLCSDQSDARVRLKWPIRSRHLKRETPAQCHDLVSNRFLVGLDRSQSLAEDGLGESRWRGSWGWCSLFVKIIPKHDTFTQKKKSLRIDLAWVLDTTLFGKLSASWPAPPYRPDNEARTESVR